MRACPISAAAVARILAAFKVGLPACLPLAAAALADERVPQSPSAAEETRLRAACIVAGEQILASNAMRSAVYQEQFSRYIARTNRCHVEMRVQTIDRDEHSDGFGRYLYDGDTKELLAFAQIRDGKKSGRVFDLNHRTISFENGGFDDASEFIHEVMARGR